MRGGLFVAVALLFASGCAHRIVAPTAPAREASAAVAASHPTACAAPTGRDVPPNWCSLPSDVRNFVDDRDLCEHFRGEPWPTSDSAADRQRRRELVEGVRTSCGGTDARLTELRSRYSGNAAVMSLLSAPDASGDAPEH